MASFPTFDIVIHHKGKEGRVYNVNPDKYCYFDALEDVYTSVLSDLPSSEAAAISLCCDIPGMIREGL